MNPFELTLPPTCHTDRLTIGPLKPQDCRDLHAAIQESARCLQEWLDWAHPLPPLTQCKETCHRFYAAWIMREQFHFALRRRTDQQFVGMVGPRHVNWHIPSAEIGYWCRTSCQRQGYIVEATRAISDYAFSHMKMKSLFLLCDDANISSIAVAEKLGMKLQLRAGGLVAKPGSQQLRVGRQYAHLAETYRELGLTNEEFLRHDE